MVRAVSLSLWILLPAWCSADEAVRRDGSRIKGHVAIVAGKFVFQSGGTNVPVANLDLVRFKPKSLPTPRQPLWHQVKLAHGQSMLAEIRKLDTTHLRVRPSWGADELAIPRPVIERIGHRPGWQPVVLDTFDRDLSQWTAVGEPRVADGKLTFEKAGQSIASPIKSPFAVGQIVVGAEFAQNQNQIAPPGIDFQEVRESSRRTHRNRARLPGDIVDQAEGGTSGRALGNSPARRRF